MSVKIKLKRLGKIRNPQYRIVVADARTARDGRAIEEIGRYHPKEEPSLIVVESDRVQYWLGVGAQPTDAVAALLKITGDWQKFKGEPGAEGTLKVREPKADKQAVFAAAVEDGVKAKDEKPVKLKTKQEKAEEAAAAKAEEAAEAEAVEEIVEEAVEEAVIEAVVEAEAEAEVVEEAEAEQAAGDAEAKDA